jgi:hypothetical protein
MNNNNNNSVPTLLCCAAAVTTLLKIEIYSTKHDCVNFTTNFQTVCRCTQKTAFGKYKPTAENPRLCGSVGVHIWQHRQQP